MAEVNEAEQSGFDMRALTSVQSRFQGALQKTAKKQLFAERAE